MNIKPSEQIPLVSHLETSDGAAWQADMKSCSEERAGKKLREGKYQVVWQTAGLSTRKKSWGLSRKKDL